MRRKLKLAWQCNLFSPLLLLLFSFLTNCVHQPVQPVLPPDIEITPLASLDAPVFAVGPTEEKIALATDGLTVIEAETGAVRWRDLRIPQQLAWDADGQQVAAVFFEGEGQTRLVVFSLEDKVQHEQVIEGNVRGLGFSNDGLVVALVDVVRSYRFGEHREIRLIRWDGKSSPVVDELGGTTVEPVSQRRFGAILNRSQWVDFSPWRDEILFARLHDPPASDPYCELVIRHLAQGSERILTRTKIDSVGGRFYLGGERVVYDAGDGRLSELDAWGGESRPLTDLSQATVAIAARSQFVWVGNRLFENGREKIYLPFSDAGAFAGDSFYFVRHNRLYRLSGLAPEEPVPRADESPSLSDTLLHLRAWRAAGLISPQEFDEQKERFEP